MQQYCLERQYDAIDVQMGLFCRDIQVYCVLSKPACQYYSNNTYKHKVI